MSDKLVDLNIEFRASLYHNDEIDKLAFKLIDNFNQLIKLNERCDCNEQTNQEESK